MMHDEETEWTALKTEDRYLFEAASRALHEAARILGTWRDYKPHVETLLAVKDRIVKRVEVSDRLVRKAPKIRKSVVTEVAEELDE